MITQIKKVGNSLIIRLPSEFVKYMGLEEFDWVNISDLHKTKSKEDKEVKDD